MFTREQIKAIITAKLGNEPRSASMEQNAFNDYCSESFAKYLGENEQVKQSIDKAFDKFRATSKCLIVKSHLQMLTINELHLELLGNLGAPKVFGLIEDVIRSEVGDDNSCFLYLKKGIGGGLGRWKDLSEVEAQNLMNERALNKVRSEARKIEQQQKWEAEEKERLARLERRENELKELKAKIASFENEHGQLDCADLFDKEEETILVSDREDHDTPPSSC